MPNENIVDFVAMGNAASAIDLTHAQLQQIDKDMIKAVEALEVNWTGAASFQFSSVMTDWQGSFNDICNKLGDLHFALVGNRDLNVKNEANNTPMINHVRTQLHTGP
jgi:WXG100 family type VII secretion target